MKQALRMLEFGGIESKKAEYKGTTWKYEWKKKLFSFPNLNCNSNSNHYSNTNLNHYSNQKLKIRGV